MVECCLIVCLLRHDTTFIDRCAFAYYRYSEDSLCVVTQDSMTIREIGEILFYETAEHLYLFFTKDL